MTILTSALIEGLKQENARLRSMLAATQSELHDERTTRNNIARQCADLHDRAISVDQREREVERLIHEAESARDGAIGQVGQLEEKLRRLRAEAETVRAEREAAAVQVDELIKRWNADVRALAAHLCDLLNSDATQRQGIAMTHPSAAALVRDDVRESYLRKISPLFYRDRDYLFAALDAARRQLDERIVAAKFAVRDGWAVEYLPGEHADSEVVVARFVVRGNEVIAYLPEALAHRALNADGGRELKIAVPPFEEPTEELKPGDDPVKDWLR